MPDTSLVEKEKPPAKPSKGWIIALLFFSLFFAVFIFIVAIALHQKWVSIGQVFIVGLFFTILISAIVFVIWYFWLRKPKAEGKKRFTKTQIRNHLHELMQQITMNGGAAVYLDLTKATIDTFKIRGKEKKHKIYHLRARDYHSTDIYDVIARVDDDEINDLKDIEHCWGNYKYEDSDPFSFQRYEEIVDMEINNLAENIGDTITEIIRDTNTGEIVKEISKPIQKIKEEETKELS